MAFFVLLVIRTINPEPVPCHSDGERSPDIGGHPLRCTAARRARPVDVSHRQLRIDGISGKGLKRKNRLMRGRRC
jgi:hypothetical protein